MLSRKMVVVLAGFVFCCVQLVPAAAPMVKSQVPGYYRMMLGKFEITALNDGISSMSGGILNNIEKADLDKILESNFSSDGGVPAAINTFLVNTGEKLILIDTGFGRFIGNLKAAGYEPGQVDIVLITHAHGDHTGGLNDAEGKANFPNAQVYISRLENDTQNTGALDKFTSIYKDRWHTFDFGTEIVPGIKATDAKGHTPGHTTFVVESDGQKLYVWGDTIHAGAVQLARPDVTINYDTDKKQAAETRIALMKTIADEKAFVAGMHLPFPGIGRLWPEVNGAYTLVPVTYAPLTTGGR